MNLVLFYSLSFSVFISQSSGNEALYFYEQAKNDCAPAKCGNVTNITFPFWLEKQQPSYCGFPASKITCENHIPNLLKSDSYSFSLQVKRIFYENRSVLVVDETLAGGKCRHWSFPYDFTLLRISEANKNLVFLFNCSRPHLQFHKINCTSSDNSSTYVAWDTDLKSFDTCHYANMSVAAGYVEDNISNYMRAVKYGFLLDWPATDCEKCSDSHGHCGYNETYSGFMCICPDGLYRITCLSNYHLEKGHFGTVIAALAGVGGLFLGMCFVLSLRLLRKRKLKVNSSNLLSQTTSSKLSSKMDHEAGETNYNTHIFTYDELEVATHGFHESRELGDGGFGTVYKGPTLGESDWSR